MHNSEVYIGRQPILDGDMKLYAYELRFHQGMNPNVHSLLATEELIDETENNIGFQAIVGSYPSMLHLPASMLSLDRIDKFSSDHLVVLEVTTDILDKVDVLRNLKELKMKGYHFLLDEYSADGACEKLSTITGYAKFQVRNFSEIQLKEMVEHLHERGIKVIAEAVENEDEFNHLKQLGFDYFQGYFFTNPTVVNGRKLSGNPMSLLQLMAKVNSAETDFAELTSIISQDVGLSHKLLMAINHPANDIPVRVENIADGLKYMGLKRLKFWVNLLMLSSLEDVPQELLTTSLLNAKFCELMSSQSGKPHDKDSFFLVGLLSNLDAYFKTPINEVVEALPLSLELSDALVNHSGPMGHVLDILNVMQNRPDEAKDLEFEGLGIAQISNNFLSAAAWAQQAVTA
ncbi:EAL and HDOD domain-containing protein [Thiomicrorhabdus sp.]|uniref:EAL and HDOD domain-containing protein n=1 Tax=Thiomicrorhabdus sp. TaxID=2039724 RepID=UPI00356A15E9